MTNKNIFGEKNAIEVRDKFDDKFLQKQVTSLTYLRNDASAKKIRVAVEMGSGDLIYTFPNQIAIKISLGEILRIAESQTNLDTNKLFEEDDYLLN